MEFSRQQYWSALPFPGDLPNPGIELTSPVSPALAARFFTIEPPGKPLDYGCVCVCLVPQSCSTLCDPKDCNPPGSAVHGIPQAGILEYVVISFSRGSFWPMDRTQVFCTADRFFNCLSHQGSPGLWILLFKSVVAAAAKSLQSCPTLCDPRECSLPGSPIPGILQARTQEWVAISFSNAWKWKVKVKLLSRVWLLATPWTAAHQAPLSMGFSRQQYWSGVPLPSPFKSVTIAIFHSYQLHVSVTQWKEKWLWSQSDLCFVFLLLPFYNCVTLENYLNSLSHSFFQLLNTDELTDFF